MPFNIHFDLKWLIVPILIIVGLLIFGNYHSYSKNKQLETYNRQLEGNLSKLERQMQEANKQLGVSKSELITQEELAKRVQKDKEELDKDFEIFKKKYNLVIKNRDRTIASLKQKINGGTTNVIVSWDQDGCKGIEDRCVISYNWEDHLKRFRLKDPNIFTPNDEIFESDQIFKIYGEIYQQKDSSLQTRRLVLREVYKDENGEYRPVPNGKADIIDSEFQYSNAPLIRQNLFRLRAIMLGSITAFPDNGHLRMGLGLEFFSWKDFGVNSHIAFDFEDIKQIEPRVGLEYSPVLFGEELNLAIGISAGTPFANMFKDYSLNLDLIFYINQ